MLYVLEEIFKTKKSQHSEYLNLRIQRSLSWLKKAMLLEDDLDLQLISLWIAFAALQAQHYITKDQDNLATQTNTMQYEFLMQLYSLDHESKIRQILWGKAQPAVEFLIQHPYTSQDYWDYKNQIIPENVWKARFSSEQQAVSDMLNQHDAKQVLALLFKKMSVLNLQLLQGGAHYASTFNRASLQNSCTLLKALLPQFIQILLDHPNRLDTQKPFYPMLQLS